MQCTCLHYNEIIPKFIITIFLMHNYFFTIASLPYFLPLSFYIMVSIYYISLSSTLFIYLSIPLSLSLSLSHSVFSLSISHSLSLSLPLYLSFSLPLSFSLTFSLSVSLSLSLYIFVICLRSQLVLHTWCFSDCNVKHYFNISVFLFLS